MLLVDLAAVVMARKVAPLQVGQQIQAAAVAQGQSRGLAVLV
jgi:hypothetical protein